MLELAREDDARVVYASSSEVYGGPEVFPTPESYEGRVDPLGPRSCYEEGKRFAEALCKAYWDEYGLDVRTGRTFNMGRGLGLACLMVEWFSGLFYER